MSVEVVIQQTDVGWDTHTTGGSPDVVVRLEGTRIVVAVEPAGTPPTTQPLPLSLAETPETQP